MKILIADSSEMVCQRLLAMLHNVEGIEGIQKAHTIHELFILIKLFNPDVVMVDVQMLGMGGLEIVKRIHQVVPVTILLANNHILHYRKRFKAVGADFLLDKTADFEQIISLLNNISFQKVA
ncbi:MAG: response regulator [Bacteroidota bacterium]|nr:response regulator [Bacteroidota bacterium]